MILRYRGREIRPADIDFINSFIAARPGKSRRALSLQLSREWNWTQPNVELCDVQCRGLLLAL